MKKMGWLPILTLLIAGCAQEAESEETFYKEESTEDWQVEIEDVGEEEERRLTVTYIGDDDIERLQVEYEGFRIRPNSEEDTSATIRDLSERPSYEVIIHWRDEENERYEESVTLDIDEE
ncbi:hypothetical protein HUG15_06875 [Salicibibacter cibarius]|uniref:DUF3221 domain-containing protein n=1 Tax=Salicibibacter cibarius TaxID=2743000 RepID=A0A7T6Z209_9BACI|nr:hypothetical protein [Salicibibacter cibarius]QQK75338.1 hypothetical protein HUG15_06875 [Salicibibacter cibarius]